MPIIYKNTDGTRWGTGKGAPLTSLEIDLNFWQVIERLVAVETNPIRPVEIDSIEITGNKLIFHMSDYSDFGPFDLPEAAFDFTGDFIPFHNYSKYDFLTAREGLYMVLHPFTSGSTFVLGSDLDGPWYRLIMPFPTVLAIGFSFPGKPGFGIAVDEYEAQAMWSYRADRQFYLPATLTGSVGGLLIQADDDMVLPIMRNLDQIGTINITAGAVDCTFTFADNEQFEINDVVRVLRPIDIDATAKDLTVTLQGRLGEVP